MARIDLVDLAHSYNGNAADPESFALKREREAEGRDEECPGRGAKRLHCAATFASKVSATAPDRPCGTVYSNASGQENERPGATPAFSL